MAGATLASPTADAPPAAVVRRKHVSPGMEAWRRFRRHRMAVVGAVVLTLLICGVLFGPFFWPVSVSDIDFSAMLQGPSAAHPLGTDDLGQDLLARMISGGRISLAVGLAAMFVAVVVGVLVGSIAGISRGGVDTALMWLTDLFLSLPQLPPLLVVRSEEHTSELQSLMRISYAAFCL